VAHSRDALEEMTREDLLAEARRIGARRPEVMTRVELVDEVLRLTTPNPIERKKVRGWLGVARDLVASVVEQGLNLPDAAAMIRGDIRFEPLRAPQSPVATVTLAEIYGAQGHYDRAFGILDEVLVKEPEHEVARRLRDRLSIERGSRKSGERAAKAEDVAPSEDVASLADAAPEADLEPDSSVDGFTLIPPHEASVADEPHADSEPPVPNGDPEPLLDSSEELPTLAPPPERRNAAREVAAVVAWTGADTAAVYFELGNEQDGAAPLMVRVLEVRPRPTGAERAVHDVPITGTRGTARVYHLEPGSVIRAAIGWTERGEFKALTVAALVHLGVNGKTAVTWSPRKTVDYRVLAERGSKALSPPSSSSDAHA
jgi:hypothetical protein